MKIMVLGFSRTPECIYIYIYGLTLVSTEPADGLAPNVARPSADNAAFQINMILLKFKGSHHIWSPRSHKWILVALKGLGYETEWASKDNHYEIIIYHITRCVGQQEGQRSRQWTLTKLASKSGWKQIPSQTTFGKKIFINVFIWNLSYDTWAFFSPKLIFAKYMEANVGCFPYMKIITNKLRQSPGHQTVLFLNSLWPSGTI